MSEGMVEGCIERAMTYVYDFKPFPKLFIKAAAILYSIIVFHPFVDGNKRTAFQTTRIFLRLNGYDLIVGTEEGVRFTKAIASLEVKDIESIVEWLTTHSNRRLRWLIASYFTKFLLVSHYKMSKEERRRAPGHVLLLAEAIKAYPD